MENQNQEITVLGEYVLVKQTMTKKKRLISLEAARSEQDKFDFNFEVLQKGLECKKEGINIGDHPIFEKHVQFEGLKVLNKDKNSMVSLVIVHENSIIGIDNSPSPNNLAPNPAIHN